MKDINYRLKSGILNFSNLIGFVLVIVSLWGDKLYIQKDAEIQNTDLTTTTVTIDNTELVYEDWEPKTK